MKKLLISSIVVFLSFGTAGSGIARQPPPPAERANGEEHWRDVLPPEDQQECRTRCRVDSETERCAARLCEPNAHPVLTIRAVDSGIKFLGDRIELSGDFGTPRNDQLVALVHPCEDRDRHRGRRLCVRHRLQVIRWDENHIVVGLHDEVDTGQQYGLVVLYNLTEGRRAAPIFKQGSNYVSVEVRPRR